MSESISAFAAAGPYLQEINASQQTGGVSTTIGCVTAGFKRGPVGPYTVTAGGSFTSNYGPVDTSWGFGHITALAFLNQGKQLIVNRAVDPSTCNYAAAEVYNETRPLGGGNFTYITPAYNMQLPYANANSSTENEMVTAQLIFNTPLVTGDTVTVTVEVPSATGGSPTGYTTPSVAFVSNNDTTMIALANAVSNLLNITAGLTATVQAINPTNANTSLGLEIMLPYTTATYGITFTGTITGSVAGAGAQQQNTLFQVFARDPGAYGNNIGISISNANTAPPPNIIFTLNYNNAMHNYKLSITITYNGANYLITATGAGLNGLLASLNTQLVQTFGGNSSVSYSYNSGGGSINIQLFAPTINGTFVSSINAVAATDTTSSTVLVISSLINTPNTALNSFTLNVYLSGSTQPVETFVVSLNKQVDGFGRQQFIEDVINNGTSGIPSQYIRVVATGSSLNPAGTVSPSFYTGITSSTSSPIVYLSGGADGLQPTDSDIVTAISLLQSIENYTFNIVLNAGYTDVVVQQALVNLAQTRQDSFVILDMPSNVQYPATACATYASSTLGVNSSYAGIYTPDVYILDTTNNQYIYAPPSGYVGACFAANDQNFAVWFAPAGLNRGVLQNVVSLAYNYDIGDRNTLAAAQVCPIKPARNGSGNVIWDVWTLSTPLSLLSYNSIRRTFIYLEQSILTSLEGDVFDNITPQTEFLITQAISSFLQPIQNAQGITNFLVLCNSTNNPAYLTDIGELVVTVYIVPVVPARIIALRTVVTPNSVTFQELISQGIF